MSIKRKLFNRLNNFAKNLGYRIVSLDDPSTRDADFILYEYKDEGGNFDYDKYKAVQEKGNEIKIDQVWVLEDNIKFLSDYLKQKSGKLDFGLCHGTRRGLEQEWFRKYLDAEVIGTEISDNATEFPYTIQWDFHEVKEEWVEKTDFIYSNSLDHSYDPEKCLNAWMQCLKPGGLCIIEHSNLDTPKSSNRLDAFGAKIEMMPYLIAKWGKNQYFLRELMHAPNKHPHLEYLYFLIIEKR